MRPGMGMYFKYDPTISWQTNPQFGANTLEKIWVVLLLF